MVDELMNYFWEPGARISVKMYFFRSHLDYFPENCGDFSEEQGEHFHQDFRGMEKAIKVDKMADYCWCLKRNVQSAQHKRKLLRRPFILK